ncbi:hypothetical protein IHQ71_30205 (plasmid) [Rhizobium sp. TH2]|uniref:hypothetical protein n=1 Tax=Rhizobium sp. TH2 TaxID=2775403 RepID=UPI00215833FE|nr:hypothetical protein [Rhizobium sp. TH2]UVC12514.1 hypothetical protein IHQ71_30205 [Rhizobium sp. TH2]
MNTPLQPEQFDIVHGVFKRLAGEPWFSRDIVRQQQFASYCLHTYQAGETDPDRLFEACERMARETFRT